MIFFNPFLEAEVFYKNFTKFTGKHLCQNLFVNKAVGLIVLSCKFYKIFRNTFFTEHLCTTASVFLSNVPFRFPWKSLIIRCLQGTQKRKLGRNGLSLSWLTIQPWLTKTINHITLRIINKNSPELLTFTEEILNGKFLFPCSVISAWKSFLVFSACIQNLNISVSHFRQYYDWTGKMFFILNPNFNSQSFSTIC